MGNKLDASAVTFFREHAGYSYGPGETPAQGRERVARRLARAESRARTRGVSFDWSHDDMTSAEWLDDSDPAVEDNGGHWRTWQCVARNALGEVVASLHGIDFGPDGSPWSDLYRRVVEAELAVEAGY